MRLPGSAAAARAGVGWTRPRRLFSSPMEPLAALMIGLGLGALLALPLAIVWSRRTARRVRRLEQRARAAERLAELGTLTGGLAHEIKNPLSTIGLNIQLLQEDLNDIAEQVPTGASSEEKFGRVQRRFGALGRETQRLREILEDFLRFAGRVELDLEATDLNALIDELTDFFEPQARAGQVNLRTQLMAQPAIAMADPSLLKQALLNLLINGLQAMAEAREKGKPHGGASELIVRTERRRPLDHDEIHIHITDTGPGMSEDVAAKVFQPYFSTKRGGTGLGLPTTRRIIEEHGGHIDVHAAVGQGTDFTIALPAALDEASAS
ncbi:sensor histidine kinase [Phycisphaerales bacterium AB-hyl4]|uniref:histidine kinase n=1 Tax=Natronomicrosphaera hydrolytica TaxID=3242702 RepID=A0ABV4U2H2_9BACT